jgi:hypothetical protein
MYLVVTTNKVTNYFEGLVTIGSRPDVVRGPRVGRRWIMGDPLTANLLTIDLQFLM